MVWPILNDGQNNALKEIVKTQSDRVAAILGGAMLEDSLQLSIRARLRESSLTDKLFGVSGALGNLGPKIDLAYLLCIIENDVRVAMTGLAKIRNLFAHNLCASFADSSKSTADAFAQLGLHVDKTHYPTANEGDPAFPFEDVSIRHGIWLST